jgi:hypothetical protein
MVPVVLDSAAAMPTRYEPSCSLNTRSARFVASAAMVVANPSMMAKF